MKRTTLAAITLAASSAAYAIHPTATFLDALGQVESNNNPKAIGDGNKARGTFQFWKIAWADANEYRRERGLKIFSYEYANDPHVSRLYAANFADQQRLRFIKGAKREPSAGELYALFNLGYQGFKRRGFDLTRCPKVTRRAAAKLQRLMREGK